jgi:hypothetical protein
MAINRDKNYMNLLDIFITRFALHYTLPIFKKHSNLKYKISDSFAKNSPKPYLDLI